MIEQTDPEAIVAEAKQHLRAGDSEKAVELLRQLIDDDADCLKAHETLAAVYYRNGDLEQAIEEFRTVSRLDPRQQRSDINIGAIYNRLGKFDDAVKALRRGIGKDRKSHDGYYNLGLAYRGLNQLSMAVSAYREAIRLDPEMSEAHLNLGNVFVEMGNFQQAILHYKLALELRPGFERAERGLIHAEQQREQAQQSVSPFGRLVSEAELAKAVVTNATRELTDDERIDDRHTVRQLSIEITGSTAMLLECVKKELEPALMALARAAAQGEDSPTLLGNSLPAFQTALVTYLDRRATLNRHLDQLRSHEAYIAGDDN